MAGKSNGPSFSAGRDQSVAYTEHGDATLYAWVSNAPGGDDAALLAQLAAIRELLGRLQAPEAAEAVKQAEAAVVSPKPDRATVLSRLEKGVKIASALDGFAVHAGALIPRLQAVASWAGVAWESWRPTLGL